MKNRKWFVHGKHTINTDHLTRVYAPEQYFLNKHSEGTWIIVLGQIGSDEGYTIEFNGEHKAKEFWDSLRAFLVTSEADNAN
jgi:hypothetical protein